MAAQQLLFYYIQNDKGESGAHPNTCRLKPADPARVVLQDVLDAFPLAGTASFHFRFQVKQDNQLLFMDVVHPSDPVPLMGANAIAKVLRLDTVKCSAHNAAGLQLRSYRPGAAPSAGASTRRDPGAGVSAAQAAAVAAAMAMPTMSGSHHDVPKETDGDGDARVVDNGQGEDIYRKMKAVDARGMRPVKSMAADVGVALPPPTTVDADLEGKSDYVKAKVMAARESASAAAAVAVAELAARDAAASDVASAKEAARAVHEARLRDWAMETGGKSVKPIRALLATVHTVLWEGARWEPVNMGKLVVASRVKLFFLKACTVVHPDKAAGLGGEQQYIAGQVFDYLNTSFREFSAVELGT